VSGQLSISHMGINSTIPPRVHQSMCTRTATAMGCMYNYTARPQCKWSFKNPQTHPPTHPPTDRQIRAHTDGNRSTAPQILGAFCKLHLMYQRACTFSAFAITVSRQIFASRLQPSQNWPVTRPALHSERTLIPRANAESAGQITDFCERAYAPQWNCKKKLLSKNHVYHSLVAIKRHHGQKLYNRISLQTCIHSTMVANRTDFSNLFESYC
jgi:hypothetical protein